MNSKCMRRSVTSIGLAALLSSGPAWGAGFQINEHAAPATGRASAVTATIDDPSAIFHNPAGLTQTKGTQFMVGLTLIRPRGEYSGTGLPSTNGTGAPVSQETIQSFVPVPNAYVSRALSEKAFVGFGFYAPYGLGISWENPDEFVGRTVVQELSMRTFFLTPAIALKLSDMVSVAVGVSLVPATVYLKQVLGAADDGQVLFPKTQYSKEGTLEVAGSAFGVGANAGVQLSLIENLRVGLAFRSAVDLAFTGDANFDLPAELPSAIKANFPDQTGSADLTIPHSFALGIGWVQGPLVIEASGQLTLWNSYDELRLSFDTGKPAESRASPKDWKPVPLLRLGGQYSIADAVVRAGLAYDMTPVPDSTVDPTLPDNNRIIFTLGGGYDFGPVRADLAYMGLILGDREANESQNFAPGTYVGGMVHLISVSAGVEL